MQICGTNHRQMDLPHDVRVSCKNFKSAIAWLNEKETVAFAKTSLSVDEIKIFCESNVGLSTNRFDREVNFQSVDEEAGFLVIAHGLDFGSGFRPLLHQHRNGAGAWLTVRAGLVKMGNAQPSCPSQWLASLTLAEIKEFFDLRHSDLDPLAYQLLEAIHEFGTNLTTLGFANAGEFVSTHAPRGATHLVNVLVESFPNIFKDEYVVRGHPVCFYKKAQLVVSEIHMRFFRSSPGKYCFGDIDNLTAFVDNVVVAMMRRYGCVQCSPELDQCLTAEEPLLKGSEEEVALRSAALSGVELIVEVLREQQAREEDNDGERPINAQMVCNYLWGHLGKLGDNRLFPRHLTPSTSFY